MTVERRVSKLVTLMEPYANSWQRRNDIPCSNYVLRMAIRQGYVQRNKTGEIRLTPSLTRHFNMITELLDFVDREVSYT